MVVLDTHNLDLYFRLVLCRNLFVVKKWGIKWIDVVMPPAVMGAVVAIIGLELAPCCGATSRTCTMANGHRQRCSFCHDSSDTGFDVYRDYRNCIVQGLYASDSNSLCRGCRLAFLALFMGLVDTAKISEAAWFALPKFQVRFMI
jgi:uracil permease